MALDEATEAAVDELYAAPRTQFTTARDALARRLRREGDAEAAAAVRALRKPTVVAAAANGAVRADRAAVEALLAAGAQAAEMQAAAAAGDATGAELKEAASALRAAVEAVVAVARRIGVVKPGDELELAETLRAAAVDGAGRDLLRRGRFSGAVTGAGFEGVAVTDAALGRADELRQARERRAAELARLEQAAIDAEAEAARLDEEAEAAEEDAVRARRAADAAAMRAEDLRRRVEEAHGG